jgi:putative transposase
MRQKTPSFIAEFPLIVTVADARALSIRINAARHIYNAALGEALRRLDRMRATAEWAAASALPKGEPRSPARKARAEAFKAIMARFEFSSPSIQKLAERSRDACWIGDHLGSHDTQTASLRAFRAVEQFCFGKRGRPRFKGFGRFHSIEGKSNAAVIRYRDGAVHYSGLVLPVMRDPRDRDGWQAEAMARRVKYVRIVRRELRGQTRWLAQLVMEGLPPVKARRPAADGIVGLDLGPSAIAAVSGADATLEPFCPSVVHPWRELRRTERAMDRSRRATNPDAFNPDGTWKRGGKRQKLNRSVRYQQLALARRERERRLSAERKRAHGELCNRILAQGKDIRLERLSYRAFQKSFGRSVKVRAPGMFVSMLIRKAESAGGEVTEIRTRNTKLSQFDHTTGEYVKKPLSQRTHFFGDGQTKPVQRDLYSAFLARHCGEDCLDIRQVLEAWPDTEPFLRRAVSKDNKSASGCGFPLPHGPAVGADRAPKRNISLREAA